MKTVSVGRAPDRPAPAAAQARGGGATARRRWLPRLAALLAVAAAGAHGTDARAAAPDAAWTAAWTGVEPPGHGWTPRVSPGLPERWPPDGQGRLVFYGFAEAFDPALADGVAVLAPWGRRPGAAGAVELLERRPRRLGVQGVRPQRAGEAEGMAAADAAGRAALLPPDAASSALIRRFYCGWRGRQGVIAAALATRHAAFFRWLDCDRG